MVNSSSVSFQGVQSTEGDCGQRGLRQWLTAAQYHFKVFSRLKGIVDSEGSDSG